MESYIVLFILVGLCILFAILIGLTIYLIITYIKDTADIEKIYRKRLSEKENDFYDLDY